MKYQGIIFDLDGVICSTDEFHYQAWKQLSDRLQIPFDRERNRLLRGVSRMQSLEIILEKSDRAYSDAEKAAYKSGRLKTVTLAYYPGEINSVKTFTFKKVTVPKKYAKMIKAQQAALIWGILPVEAAHR